MLPYKEDGEVGELELGVCSFGGERDFQGLKPGFSWYVGAEAPTLGRRRTRDSSLADSGWGRKKKQVPALLGMTSFGVSFFWFVFLIFWFGKPEDAA